MKGCPRCGRIMGDGIKFCTGCGAYLEQPVQNYQNMGYSMSTARCRRCGNPHDGRSRFCVKCGLELKPQPVEAAPPVPEKPQKKCPGCGRIFCDESIYCNMCGLKLEIPGTEHDADSTSVMEKAPTDVVYNDVVIIREDEDGDAPSISNIPFVGNCPVCGVSVHSYSGICQACGSRIRE